MAGPSQEALTLATLLDERAVRDVLTDYARALDTRDWPLLSSLFTPDAVVDYTAEGGPVCHGPAAVVDDCRADFEGLDATQHLIGNVAVRVDGDEATATSSVQAWHHRDRTDGGTTYFIAGGYRDRLARRADGGWRIAHRTFLVAFSFGDPAVKVRG